MADGSVKIDVGLNIGKAEKDLSKLVDKINKAEDALNAESDKKNGLVQQIDAANKKLDEAKEKAIEVQKELQQESAAADAKLDEAKATVNDIRAEMAGARGSAKAEIRERLNEALDNQRMYQAEADRLAKETAKATEELTTGSKEVRETQKEINKLNNELDKTNAKIEQGEKNLTEMKEEAGQLTKQIEAARPGDAIARSLDSAKKSMMKFLKYAFGIRSVYILFQRLKSSIKSAVQEYAEYDKELKYNLALMTATKKAIQVTNGAALASIYNALLPIIQKITNWTLEAANAAAKFIAILSGKDSYKRAVVDAEEVAASLEDVSEEAKEAKRQLLGFDELNILNDYAGSGSSGKKDKTALDGIKMVDEAIDPFDDSFIARLAATVKDVLFDWSDLNPEQIAEKIIAGLGGLLFAALGISLGLGPGGVILMTLAGIALGLIADSLIFDHDGKISQEEMSKMITMAVMGLIGGVAGFALTGSLAGGFVGTIVGAALALKFYDLIVGKDGLKFDASAFKDNLYIILNSVIGGVAGFALTGGSAVGAAFGLVVGFGLTMGLQYLKTKMNPVQSDIMENVLRFLTIAAGGVIGFTLGSVIPGLGNVAGAIVGTLIATLAVTLASIFLKDKPETAADAFMNSEFGQQVAELKEDIEENISNLADLHVKIQSITGEVDEETMVNFNAAQELVESIFTLDGKENLTSTEAEILKQKIEALKNLGGPELHFDEETGHIRESRQEVQGLMQDLLRKYQLEAMGEAYVEALREQNRVREEGLAAAENSTRAQEAYNQALANQQSAQESLNNAEAEYNRLLAEQKANYNDHTLGTKVEEAKKKVEEAQQALSVASAGVSTTKQVATEARDALQAAYDGIDEATAKVSEIEQAFSGIVGAATDAGVNAVEGQAGAVTDNAYKSVDAVKAMIQDGMDAMDTLLDAHSPSKEYGKRGQWSAEGYQQGLEEGTPAAVAAAENLANQTVAAIQEGADNTVSVAERMRTDIVSVFQGMVQDVSGLLDQLRGMMNFEWFIPRPKIPVIDVFYDYAQNGDGSSIPIPRFNLSWFAKGGVFDYPQLIGVGEAGKEAVVPLERNTEWMNLVADGLMERFERMNFANQLAEAFASVPMPAMAGGTVAPPNALFSKFGGGTGDGFLEELRALRSEISALARQPIQVDTKMYLDRRKIGESVTEYQRDNERARGF